MAHYKNFLENQEVFFSKNWTADNQKYSNIHTITPKPNCPPNTFSIPMVSWTHFTSFNLNLQKGYTHLAPILTLGKYIEKNGIYTIPFSIQVHHAVCNGFHISRFIEELETLIQK